jgi:acyl-CoA synthetase (AMP-forming)/AMP-acid ligase II/thioesterase domain-containing protein
MRRSVSLDPKPVTACPPNPGVGQDTIGSELRRRAEQQPDHPAIVSTGLKPFSYSELRDLIDDVCVALRAAGFGPRSRIAISLPSGPLAALAIVAVACSAISIPVNPRQTQREIENEFKALRPDAVLLLKGSNSDARRVAEQSGLAIIEITQIKDGALGFGGIESPEGPDGGAPECDDPEPNTPAFILQTSGTAAEPKLIPFSHRNMLAAAARVQNWFNLTSADRCLSVSPPFYSHGLKVTVFTPLLSGGTVVFPTEASKFDYSEWFESLRPTWYSAGPTLHRLVLDQVEFRAGANSNHSLRFILSGGAPLPRNVLEGLQNSLGVPVVEHYGSSEAAQISANLPYPGRTKVGSCGVPPPGTIRIVGDSGREVPIGSQGEILVGGPTVISGYIDAPELNAKTFVDGWFRSGDIGSIDEHGFLTLHGRDNDVINRGGEKISPLEIDDALMRHPAVGEAAAFGVPHPRLGQDVAAAVVLRPGAATSSIELRKFLHDELTAFKVPRRIVIKEQLPKGATGKVLRRRLTETWNETTEPSTQLAVPRSLGDSATQNRLANDLVSIWQALLKTSQLSLDDDFFERGGDSLLATEMLVEIELLIGRTVPSSVLFEATTIRQLALKLSEQSELKSEFLVRMNSNGNLAPLTYFHGNFYRFGHGAIMLAKALGSDQPLLVVSPHGTDEEPIPHSVEAMAADRLPLILKAQPEGPYRLSGKCLGGIVAFETARLLVAAGKKVEMVVMLDPPTINASRSMQWLLSIMKQARPLVGPGVEYATAWTWFRCAQLQRLFNYRSTKERATIARFLNYSWSRRKTAIRGKLTWIRAKAQERKKQIRAEQSAGMRSGGVNFTEWQFRDARTKSYATAMANYVPRPLDVPVTYVKIDFNAGNWRRVNPDLKVVESPGTHEFPDMDIVAEHLRANLHRESSS